MLGSKDGAEKDQYRKYLFFVCVCEKFTSDLMGNIFMIIRQNVLSPSPSLDYCVTFTWRVTCLFLSHTQTFFLLHVWMSLSWPLPLKLSSCFRLFTFALCGPFSSPPPPPQVAALHGLILAGTGWNVEGKHVVLLSMLMSRLRFLFPWTKCICKTLAVMGFYTQVAIRCCYLLLSPTRWPGSPSNPLQNPLISTGNVFFLNIVFSPGEGRSGRSDDVTHLQLHFHQYGK